MINSQAQQLRRWHFMMHAKLLPSTPCMPALHFCSTGGTESILLAIKAARDFMAASRGITRPEMVVGPSAHAAYWKAAEYFNIKLVQAPLGQDFRCGTVSCKSCIVSCKMCVAPASCGNVQQIMQLLQSWLCEACYAALHPGESWCYT
jgi:hypothetical protein